MDKFKINIIQNQKYWAPYSDSFISLSTGTLTQNINHTYLDI